MSPSTVTSARLRPETGRRARSIRRHLLAERRFHPTSTGRSESVVAGHSGHFRSPKGIGSTGDGSGSRNAPHSFFERVLRDARRRLRWNCRLSETITVRLPRYWRRSTQGFRLCTTVKTPRCRLVNSLSTVSEEAGKCLTAMWTTVSRARRIQDPNLIGLWRTPMPGDSMWS